jgi:hypothetical protein
MVFAEPRKRGTPNGAALPQQPIRASIFLFFPINRFNVLLIMKKQLLLLLVTAFGSLFTAVNPAFAQNWTQTSAPSEVWHSMASSADGTKLVADTYGYGIYISTNSGATWLEIPYTRGIYFAQCSLASSADGTKLVVHTGTFDSLGNIYTSINSGVFWGQTSAPLKKWSSVASSADGSKIVATTYGDVIYFSTDSGVNWTPATVPNQYWHCAATSADGTKLVAVSGNLYSILFGGIYISTNSGATWTKTSAPSLNWYCVASSVDGNKLVAAVGGNTSGAIYTSMDSGTTWTQTSAPDQFWQSVASSADGTGLVAAANGGSPSGGPIYISTDSGATWVTANAPTNVWASVVSSADGGKLAAVNGNSGGIYVSQSAPAPGLSITPLGIATVISWLVPSTDFVLQQNSDLCTANWTDVTNAPTLNLTNLQNQVTLPLPAGNVFYRLKTPEL